MCGPCRRAAALGTLGALLALPDCATERALPELLREFVRRSKDKKVLPCALRTLHVDPIFW